jgi:hypothetical protein
MFPELGIFAAISKSGNFWFGSFADCHKMIVFPFRERYRTAAVRV